MFNFTSSQDGDKTVAALDGYLVRFSASERNTRITATIGANDEGEEYRSSGVLFWHFDAVSQGLAHSDTGVNPFDRVIDW